MKRISNSKLLSISLIIFVKFYIYIKAIITMFNTPKSIYELITIAILINLFWAIMPFYDWGNYTIPQLIDAWIKAPIITGIGVYLIKTNLVYTKQIRIYSIAVGVIGMYELFWNTLSTFSNEWLKLLSIASCLGFMFIAIKLYWWTKDNKF